MYIFQNFIDISIVFKNINIIFIYLHIFESFVQQIYPFYYLLIHIMLEDRNSKLIYIDIITHND